MPIYNFKKALGEIAIIVFSVLLATYLENLRQHLDEEQTVKEFLEGLRADLQNDIKEMEGDMASYRFNVKSFRYFANLDNPTRYQTDSVNLYKGTFFSTTTLVPNAGGYEGFKSSGKLYSIQNRVLRTLILDLYQENIPLLMKSTDTYVNRKERLALYYENNLTYDSDGTPKSLELLLSPRFRSHCNNLIYADEIMERYQITIRNAQRIVQLIEEGEH